MSNVGSNLILIRAGAHTQAGAIADLKPLTVEDATAIRRQCGNLLVGVAEVQVTQRVATTPTHHHATMIVGSSPDMKPVRGWSVRHGRFYDDDMKKQAAICVIGQTVREKLFPNQPNPVGQLVRVDRLQLRVIGVLAPKGRTPTGGDQDDQIFVPLTTLQRKLVGEESVSIILTAVRSPDQIDRAKMEIGNVLREKHRVKPGAEDFDVSSVREMAELADVLMNTMRVLIAFIASISLLVGGIGIMNIMLVSVTERTREIGIRMAVGARGSDILVQFLIEAVVLALLGGLLGIGLGIGGAVVVAVVVGWPLFIDPAMVLLAFAVSGGVGVFFGFYPAYKASRLDPIEALRYE